jgi:hypothetical protein
MLLLYSQHLFLAVPTVEWSATLIGIGLALGMAFGFWLGTYLTIKNDPEAQSLTEEFVPYHPRKPTLNAVERREREK